MSNLRHEPSASVSQPKRNDSLSLNRLGAAIGSLRQVILPLMALAIFPGNLEASQSTIDTDRDGLSDAKEIQIGTNPKEEDTDGDGLLDGQEYLSSPKRKDYYTGLYTEQMATDPKIADTNKDGIPDGSIRIPDGTCIYRHTYGAYDNHQHDVYCMSVYVGGVAGWLITDHPRPEGPPPQQGPSRGGMDAY